MDFNPDDPRDFENFEDLKNAPQPGWLTRIILGASLSWGMRRFMKELGMPSIRRVRKSCDLFRNAERIDIIPREDGGRGFDIVVDGLLSFCFSQDGDHFVCEGFEVGPRERGDVAIFDHWRRGQF